MNTQPTDSQKIGFKPHLKAVEAGESIAPDLRLVEDCPETFGETAFGDLVTGSNQEHFSGNARQDAEQPFAKRFLFTTLRRLVTAVVSVANLFPFVFLLFLGGCFYQFATGQTFSSFMESIRGIDSVSLILLIACYGSLLRGFGDASGTRLAKGMRFGFAFLLMAAAFLGGGIQHGLLAVACIAIWLTWHRLGVCMRHALPSTFRINRTIFSLGLAWLPMAVIVVWCLSESIGSGSSHNYSDASWTSALALSVMLWLTLAIPSFFAALTARSSEVKPLATLALLLHSPLFVALLLTAVVSLGDENGWLKAMMLGLSGAFAALSVASGGAAAAKFNGLRHRLKENAF